MSRANVDLLERSFARFNERDLAVFLADYGEGIEWHSRVDEPDAGTHCGIAAVRGYVEGWVSAFPDLAVHPEEFIDAGDWAVALTRLVGRGGASGAVVDDVYVFAARVADGKFAEVREYATKAEALEAVGLRE